MFNHFRPPLSHLGESDLYWKAFEGRVVSRCPVCLQRSSLDSVPRLLFPLLVMLRKLYRRPRLSCSSSQTLSRVVMLVLLTPVCTPLVSLGSSALFSLTSLQKPSLYRKSDFLKLLLRGPIEVWLDQLELSFCNF